MEIACSKTFLDDTGCTVENGKKPVKQPCPSTASTTYGNADAEAAFERAGWIKVGKKWTCPQHRGSV